MPCRPTPSPSETRTAVVVVALVVALGAAAGPARAADSADVERARQHHRSGEAAFKAGRFDEAFREWEEGHRLSGRPLFLLNMAHAERRRGELRGARALYKRYLLAEPQSKVRGEIETVLAQIEAALAAEAEAQVPAEPAPVAPPAMDAAPVPPPPPAPLPAAAAPADPAPSLLAPAPLPESPRFYRTWWFWTGVGAVVGLGVAAAFVLRGDAAVKSGSLGTLGRAP